MVYIFTPVQVHKMQQFAVIILLLSISTVLPIPIDNGLLGGGLTQECISNQTIDVVFLLDSSGSIGDNSHEQQKEFIIKLIRRLDLSPGKARVALVEYSSEANTKFTFSTFNADNKHLLNETVRKLTFLTGTTRTGNALKHVLNTVLPESRPDVPKILVVVTDGQSQDDLTSMSARLRDVEKLSVYAVGVAEMVDVGELALITGTSKNVFVVRRQSQLDDTLVKLITNHMCKDTIESGQQAEIICSEDSIGIKAMTRKPFEGHVFVKGHFHRDDCRFTAEDANNPTKIAITIPFESCGIQRYRSVSPKGIFVEMVIVISFHPFFITKVDQAIHVKCFYMEADKTVETPLKVSMLTTQLVIQSVPMPVCTYSLRAERPDGPSVRYARVGDTIYHRWQCKQENELDDLYGMLIHSCVVSDGQNAKIPLISGEGCGIDPHLLGTPEYYSTLRRAFKESHVFKFADRQSLYFQCQVTLCLKIDNSCDAVTPPSCPVRRHRRALEDTNSIHTIDLRSTELVILDIDESIPEPQIADSVEVVLPQNDTAEFTLTQILQRAISFSSVTETRNHCLSHLWFGLMLAILVLNVSIVTLTTTILLWKMKTNSN